jgi:hypothetical protein
VRTLSLSVSAVAIAASRSRQTIRRQRESWPCAIGREAPRSRGRPPSRSSCCPQRARRRRRVAPDRRRERRERDLRAGRGLDRAAHRRRRVSACTTPTADVIGRWRACACPAPASCGVYCGDGVVNQSSEVCDGDDLGTCCGNAGALCGVAGCCPDSGTTCTFSEAVFQNLCCNPAGAPCTDYRQCCSLSCTSGTCD